MSPRYTLRTPAYWDARGFWGSEPARAPGALEDPFVIPGENPEWVQRFHVRSDALAAFTAISDEELDVIVEYEAG